jgi:hypothetical protein
VRLRLAVTSRAWMSAEENDALDQVRGVQTFCDGPCTVRLRSRDLLMHHRRYSVVLLFTYGDR